MTIHATHALDLLQAQPLLTRRGLSAMLAEAARDAGAGGFLVARIEAEGSVLPAALVASDWSFDATQDLGLAALSAIAASPLTGVPGLPARCWDAADLAPADAEAAATLMAHGHRFIASQRLRLGTTRFLLLLSGASAFPPAAAAAAQMRALYALSLHADASSAAQPELDDGLSARERQCLSWVSEGKTSDEIALIMGLSVSTVNGHLGTAMQKIGAPAAPSWLRGIEAPAGIAPGIGFPVLTESGRSGAALFAGGPAVLDGGLLLAAHNACHALFEAACLLKAARSGRRPAMSGREIECLRLTAHGLTSDQIASRLGLSVHTANRYLSNTVEKLDAANRMHAVAKALRAGLID